MELKIYVDTEENKVVFAEAEKEFVDFLAQIMSLPLSTVSKLLNATQKSMKGCLGSLSKSMESLDCDYFESGSANGVLMRPAPFVAVPLLSLNTTPAIMYYQCKKHSTYITGCKDAVCPENSCDQKMSTTIAHNILAMSRFMKDKVPYIVMDNLEVKPLSVSIIKPFFKEYASLEEKLVQVGQAQGLAILKASLERQDVLTSVFLQKNA